MQILPIQAEPNQTFNALLAGQFCTFNVYQRSTGLFIDVLVSNTLIIGGVLCQNLNRIVRDAYLGFIGDLCFIDNEGSTDPIYTGLGSRYSFAYLEVSDLQDVV